MNKTFLGTVAMLAMVGGPAFAADMAVKARPLAPAPVAVYSWTGCYIGGNVGGGWARTKQTQVAKVSGPFAPIGSLNNDFGASDDSEFIGGGQIGCDYQYNSWVFGLQGKVDFGDIKSSHGVPTAFPGFPAPTSFTSVNKTRNVVTATARAGYLFTPAVLAYVKGGGAWARTDHTFIGHVPVDFLSESALGVDRQGWTVGGGIEWMVAPGWSVFGEYNYMDFGRENTSFVQDPATVGIADVVRRRLTVQQSLFGIIYKLNWGAGPVAARY
jgi:outer membrane immunogenic protein